MKGSVLELTMAAQIASERPPLPLCEVELEFATPRKFRFDFAFPSRMVAVEVERGTWTGGRHVTPSGFQKDVEKYNLAASLGWRVFRFTGDMVKDGRAIALLREVLRDE